MLRTWPVRLAAIRLTLSVRSFQVPATPFTLRLAAELAFGADLAGHAGHFGGEGGELLDHGVDHLADAQELAAQRAAVDLDRHRLRQVALGDRADHARDFGGRLDHVVDQLVDRAQLGVPAAGRAAHLGAVADLAFLADDLATGARTLR